MMTDKDIIDNLQKIVEKVLPNIIRTGNNTVRDGVIRSLDVVTRTCSVQVASTGEIISGLKYIANVTTPSVGMYCQLISSDPKLISRVYVLIFN